MLHARYGSIPRELLGGAPLFDTHDMWSLHQNRHGLIWRQMSASRPGDPQRLALFSPDFRSGEVYIASEAQRDGLSTYPMHHPLDKFLFANLLVTRRGVTCHACGVEDRGQGWLFVGESGAGKSTMAELWDGQPGVTVLSDERTIVRWLDGGGQIFGTPWYGSAGLLSPAHAPLTSIFFLRQAPANRLTKLKASEVIKRLLVCTYLPFWSAPGIDQSMQLFEELSLTVPCYELAFVPDGSVIRFLRAIREPQIHSIS